MKFNTLCEEKLNEGIGNKLSKRATMTYEEIAEVFKRGNDK